MENSKETEKRKLLLENGMDFESFELENEFSSKAILKAMAEYTASLQKQLDEAKEDIERLKKDIDMIDYFHADN